MVMQRRRPTRYPSSHHNPIHGVTMLMMSKIRAQGLLRLFLPVIALQIVLAVVVYVFAQVMSHIVPWFGNHVWTLYWGITGGVLISATVAYRRESRQNAGGIP